MNPDDIPVRLDLIFGTIEIQTRVMPIPNGFSYQGRSIHRGMNGNIEKITPWEENLRAIYT